MFEYGYNQLSKTQNNFKITKNLIFYIISLSYTVFVTALQYVSWVTAQRKVNLVFISICPSFGPPDLMSRETLSEESDVDMGRVAERVGP